MIKRIYFYIFSIFSIITAQELSGYGSFLLIGPTARSAALGNTMHSTIGNPSALFSNPANLGFTNNSSFYLNSSINEKYFGNHGSVGILIPGGQINYGLGISNLTIKGIEEYNSDAVYQGSFSSSDLGVIFAAAYFHRKMAWGLSAKYLESSFSLSNTDDSQAFGFDIGFTSENLFESIPLTVGFTASRFFAYRDDELLEEFAPSSAVLGLKYPIKINNIDISLFSDFSVQKTMPTSLNLGLAVDWRLQQTYQTIRRISLFLGGKGYYLEGGTNVEITELNQISNRLNFGVGLSLVYKDYNLDLDYCHNLNNFYIKRDFITISINW